MTTTRTAALTQLLDVSLSIPDRYAHLRRMRAEITARIDALVADDEDADVSDLIFDLAAIEELLS